MRHVPVIGEAEVNWGMVYGTRRVPDSYYATPYRFDKTQFVLNFYDTALCLTRKFFPACDQEGVLSEEKPIFLRECF